MKIYTKTGDGGETGLVGGTRISKTSPRIAAIGDVDELNAQIGVARACGAPLLDQELERVQNWLFNLGAELAGAAADRHESVEEAHIRFLEESMDRQVDGLPPLRNFILPGGSALAAHLHLARCICRRAERSVLELDRSERVRPNVKVFLNRLSDWLFTAARTANRDANVQDIVWKKSEA